MFSKSRNFGEGKWNESSNRMCILVKIIFKARNEKLIISYGKLSFLPSDFKLGLTEGFVAFVQVSRRMKKKKTHKNAKIIIASHREQFDETSPASIWELLFVASL